MGPGRSRLVLSQVSKDLGSSESQGGVSSELSGTQGPGFQDHRVPGLPIVTPGPSRSDSDHSTASYRRAFQRRGAGSLNVDSQSVVRLQGDF